MGRHNASRSTHARWTQQQERLHILSQPQIETPPPGRESDVLALHPEVTVCEATPETAFEPSEITNAIAFEPTPEITPAIAFEPAPEITPELTADIMSRISAAELLARHAGTRPNSRHTRSGKRALAQRPLWRRSPVIPAVAATVAVWGVGDALHLVGGQRAGSSPAKAASASTDLSALASHASSTDATVFSSPAERVSRSKRTTGDRAANASASSLPAPLPARRALPTVKMGQIVPGTWVRPSAGGESSCFCMRWGVMHDGIDLAGPEGSPIVAVGDGVVVEAGPSQGFGHWIVIQHSNGDVSVYGHMYTVLVSVGEHVVAGQHIADIGSDGQSTGPHLHFGVRQGGITGPYIDPAPWLHDRGIDVGTYNPGA